MRQLFQRYGNCSGTCTLGSKLRLNTVLAVAGNLSTTSPEEKNPPADDRLHSKDPNGGVGERGHTLRMLRSPCSDCRITFFFLAKRLQDNNLKQRKDHVIVFSFYHHRAVRLF